MTLRMSIAILVPCGGAAGLHDAENPLSRHYVAEKFSDKVLDLLGRRNSVPLTHEEYDSYIDTCTRNGAFSPEEKTLLKEALDFQFPGGDADHAGANPPSDFCGRMRRPKAWRRPSTRSGKCILWSGKRILTTPI